MQASTGYETLDIETISSKEKVAELFPNTNFTIVLMDCPWAGAKGNGNNLRSRFEFIYDGKLIDLARNAWSHFFQPTPENQVGLMGVWCMEETEVAAKKILEEAGYAYIHKAAWNKCKSDGMPISYTQLANSNLEYLVLGVKGARPSRDGMGEKQEAVLASRGFSGPSYYKLIQKVDREKFAEANHSSKPMEAYAYLQWFFTQICDQTLDYNSCAKLELFSRYETKGWISVGNQFVGKRDPTDYPSKYFVTEPKKDGERAKEGEEKEDGVLQEVEEKGEKNLKKRDRSEQAEQPAQEEQEHEQVKKPCGRAKKPVVAQSSDDQVKTLLEKLQRNMALRKGSNGRDEFIRLVQENPPETATHEQVETVLKALSKMTQKSKLMDYLVRGAYSSGLSRLPCEEQVQRMQHYFGKLIPYHTFDKDRQCFRFVQKFSMCVYFDSKDELLRNKTQIANYLTNYPEEEGKWQAPSAPENGVTLAWMLEA